MNHKKIYVCLLLIIVSTSVLQISYINTVSKKDYIIKERNLIPESIAVDSRTGIIYAGSTYKRKIVQITPDGEVSDFIPPEVDGIWSLVGMELDEKNNILWANTAHANEVMPLINPDKNKDWMTNITSFDTHNKKIIRKYNLSEPKAFLNDLTITEDGEIYVEMKN